jgi:hypothetical protein
MSINQDEDIVNGVKFHQTVQKKEWWLNLFNNCGFVNHPSLIEYFENDWVRGPLQGTPGSFHLVLTLAGDEPPTPNAVSAYNKLDMIKASLYFSRTGNIDYCFSLFDRALSGLPRFVCHRLLREEPKYKTRLIRLLSYIQLLSETSITEWHQLIIKGLQRAFGISR